jgi:hypothetical protein
MTEETLPDPVDETDVPDPEPTDEPGVKVPASVPDLEDDGSVIHDESDT